MACFSAILPDLKSAKLLREDRDDREDRGMPRKAKEAKNLALIRPEGHASLDQAFLHYADHRPAVIRPLTQTLPCNDQPANRPDPDAARCIFGLTDMNASGKTFHQYYGSCLQQRLPFC